MTAKKRVKRHTLHLPKLTGSKASKARYNHEYYEKCVKKHKKGRRR
jgi:hypothetical protein